MLLTFFITFPILASDWSGHEKRRKLEVFEAVAAMALVACIYGLFVGLVQGLPVSPAIKLTKIDGGLYFTYLRRTHCPCFHHFTECSSMHARRQIVVLFVEDVMTFIGKLKGEEESDEAFAAVL